MDAATITVPTSRKKRAHARHAMRATTRGCGTRYAGISSTSGSERPGGASRPSFRSRSTRKSLPEYLQNTSKRKRRLEERAAVTEERRDEKPVGRDARGARHERKNEQRAEALLRIADDARRGDRGDRARVRREQRDERFPPRPASRSTRSTRNAPRAR